MNGKVLLSFDVEEFDLPREHGANISLEEGVKVSSEGLKKILKVLKKNEVKATFFCTGNFAKTNPELISKIIADGHEIGCHGVDHFRPNPEDVVESKKILERVTGRKIYGYRQPRMQKIDYKKMEKAGYIYDSSVNPAFIPGRYNHLDIPTRPFYEGKILEIPTSVATIIRVPLFWLALHLFPFGLYLGLVTMSIKKTGYFATYFHPWEFADLTKYKVVPFYIKKNSSDKLVARLDKLISKLKAKKYVFETYKEFAKGYIN